MGTTLLEDPGSNPRKSKTTLVGGSAGGTRLVAPTEEGTAATPSPRASDPVVGWLVVISGPGRGSAVELGHGMNAVGRAASNRVVLDFGDDQISADDHFRVAYDPESHDFHLIPGKGTNLLYVGDKAVLVPTVLEAMTDIRLGGTVLRFVPLCTKAWNWSEA